MKIVSILEDSREKRERLHRLRIRNAELKEKILRAKESNRVEVERLARVEANLKRKQEDSVAHAAAEGRLEIVINDDDDNEQETEGDRNAKKGSLWTATMGTELF